MKRVIIAFDGSNFYHALLHHIGRTNVDYKLFMDALVTYKPDRELVRGYFYTVETPDDYGKKDHHNRFVYTMQKTPYLDLVYGKLEKRGDSWVEKGTDVNIAVDLLTGAFLDVYDVAILVSADADYIKAIEEVKRLGKHVEVTSFIKDGEFNIPQSLMKVADDIIPVTKEFLSSCWYQNR